MQAASKARDQQYHGEEGTAHFIQVSTSNEYFVVSTVALQEVITSLHYQNDTAIQNPMFGVGQVDYADLLADLEGVSGFTSGSNLALNLQATLQDDDGSESVSYTLSGYTGTTFSAGMKMATVAGQSAQMKRRA